MAVFNEPNQWEHPLGNNADTSTLPDDAAATAGIASLQKLFQIINATPLEAGGIAPDREDVNALFKYLGDSIFYSMNGGVPSYNADYDYVAGRVVSYNDNLYKCIQANGVSSTVVTPGSDTAYWRRLDNFVRSVNFINADAQGNVQGYYPSYDTLINIPVPATVTEQTDTPYSVQYNGLLVLSCTSAGFPNHLRISTQTGKLLASNIEWSADVAQCISVPVAKGQQLILSYEAAKGCGATLYPCRGEI